MEYRTDCTVGIKIIPIYRESRKDMVMGGSLNMNVRKDRKLFPLADRPLFTPIPWPRLS